MFDDMKGADSERPTVVSKEKSAIQEDVRRDTNVSRQSAVTAVGYDNAQNSDLTLDSSGLNEKKGELSKIQS